MNSVQYLKLEINQSRMPMYYKTILEFSSNGYVNQTLYPLNYFGTKKTFEFEIDVLDLQSLLNKYDFSTFFEQDVTGINGSSASIWVKYDNGLKYDRENGNITNPTYYYKSFCRELVELIPFTEIPLFY